MNFLLENKNSFSIDDVQKINQDFIITIHENKYIIENINHYCNVLVEYNFFEEVNKSSQKSVS